MDSEKNSTYARRVNNFGEEEGARQNTEKAINPTDEFAEDNNYLEEEDFSEENEETKDVNTGSMNGKYEIPSYDAYGREVRAPKVSRTKKRNKKQEALGWLISISIAIVVALLVRAFLFEIILVDGDSMYPTLNHGERLAVEKVTRYGGLPDRGDIIIVEYPDPHVGTYVKRVIGLPGDTIEVSDSVLYINGEAYPENYINPEEYIDFPQTIVPEGHVFVMGDNRGHSLDSRALNVGAIPHDAIIGHAMFVIWPLDNIHSI